MVENMFEMEITGLNLPTSTLETHPWNTNLLLLGYEQKFCFF